MRRTILLLIFLAIQLSTFSQEKSLEIIIRGNDTLIPITIPQAKECISYKKNYITAMEMVDIYEKYMVPELKKSIAISDTLAKMNEREANYQEEKYKKTADILDEERKYFKQEVKKIKRQRNIFVVISLLLSSLVIIK